MNFKLFACALVFCLFIEGIIAVEKQQESLFQHDLAIKRSPGKNHTVLLLSHDFGRNSHSIIDRVRPNTSDTLISFNYIDHDFTHDTGDDRTTVIATPLEIMPLLYMLKKCVIEDKISPISLYGFSLGAANIIYAIYFLATENQDDLLKKYGITSTEKSLLLEAIRKGKILLDTPFKSIDERISFLGPGEIMLMYKERALAHKVLSPLETLGKLKNLGMTFLLFFDIHNEEQFNQEDSSFAKNLLDANVNGTTIIISSDNGGHNATHETLWKIYSVLK